MVRYSVMGLPLGSSGLCSGSRSLVGVHAAPAGGRETPVRTEPLPTTVRVRFIRLNQRGLPAVPYGLYDSAVSQSEGELDPQVLIRIFAGFGW
jgi:hypothetical protein